MSFKKKPTKAWLARKKGEWASLAPDILLGGQWKLSIRRDVSSEDNLSVTLARTLDLPAKSSSQIMQAEDACGVAKGSFELIEYMPQDLQTSNPAAIASLLEHFTKSEGKETRKPGISIVLNIDDSLFLPAQNRDAPRELTPELKECLADCGIDGNTAGFLKAGDANRTHLLSIKAIMKTPRAKGLDADSAPLFDMLF